MSIRSAQDWQGPGVIPKPAAKELQRRGCTAVPDEVKESLALQT